MWNREPVNRLTKVAFFLASIVLPVTAGAQSSHWKMTEETDQMTDEVSYLAMTQTRDSSQFVIQCTRDFVAAYVKLRWLDVDIGESRAIRYRFDRGDVQESVWRNMQRGGGAVVFGEEAVNIARNAMRARRIIVDNGRSTVEFSLDGAAQALTKLSEKCPRFSIE